MSSAEKYRPIRALGKGAVGDVLLTVDLEARRLGVLKWLRANVEGDSDAANRFRREASLMAGREFEGVVNVWEWHTARDGRAWMAMDLVDGMEPLDFIPVGDVASTHRLLSSVGASLDLLHENGVLHRDLKPENILLRDGAAGWESVIIDLGIAKWLFADDATSTGSVFGTPQYMSVEQLNDAKRVGPATDRYALGVTAYDMLCGRKPFDGADLITLVRNQEKGDVAPLGLTRGMLTRTQDPTPVPTPALDGVMKKILSPKASARYSSCVEFAGAFHAAAIKDGVLGPALCPARVFPKVERFAIRLEGPSGSKRFELTEGPVVIGRHDRCEYVVSSGELSRVHLCLYMHQGRAWAADMRSQNGTRMDGDRLQFGRPRPLPVSGDVLCTLHNVGVEVHVEDVR